MEPGLFNSTNGDKASPPFLYLLYSLEVTRSTIYSYYFLHVKIYSHQLLSGNPWFSITIWEKMLSYHLLFNRHISTELKRMAWPSDEEMQRNTGSCPFNSCAREGISAGMDFLVSAGQSAPTNFYTISNYKSLFPLFHNANWYCSMDPATSKAFSDILNSKDEHTWKEVALPPAYRYFFF